MTIYVGYAPNFTNYRFFKTQEQAESELFMSIKCVFSDDQEKRDYLLGVARKAFADFKEGKNDDGYRNLKAIIDELY